MDTLSSGFDSQQQVLALLEQLEEAERNMIRMDRSVAQMMEFERDQLRAELARVSQESIGAADNPRRDPAFRFPQILRMTLAGFMGMFRTRNRLSDLWLFFSGG